MAKDPIGSQHAGSTSSSVSQSVPEPSFAERARTLMYLGRTGTLATMSRKHPGWPFGSLMPYSFDARGRLFCRAYANLEAEEALMTTVDRLGFRLRVRTGERLQGVRLAFSREVRSAQEARTVLVAMVREARERVGA